MTFTKRTFHFFQYTFYCKTWREVLQNNVFGEDCEDDHDIMTPAEFFRRLWDWIRPTSSLIRELKIRLN